MRVVQIDVPPLRVRGGDEIEILARHFAAIYAARYGRPVPRFEPAALGALMTHDWPGNVRELEHWVESAVVLSPDGRIGEDLLPPSYRGGTLEQPPRATQGAVVLEPGLSLDEAGRRYVRATLDACGGNKTEAARRLRVGRNTVARALKVRR